MPSVHITKDQYGKLVGFGKRGVAAYGRFLKAVKALEFGELLSFTYKIPRAPKFHRLHFVMLDALFESQEQFVGLRAEYQFRKWTEVGAGHCDFVPGPTGKPVALPRSIDYESLDDVEFAELHEAVKGFCRTPYFWRFLWPHLSDDKGAEMVDAILMQFERDLNDKRGERFSA